MAVPGAVGDGERFGTAVNSLENVESSVVLTLRRAALPILDTYSDYQQKDRHDEKTGQSWY